MVTNNSDRVHMKRCGNYSSALPQIILPSSHIQACPEERNFISQHPSRWTPVAEQRPPEDTSVRVFLPLEGIITRFDFN